MILTRGRLLVYSLIAFLAMIFVLGVLSRDAYTVGTTTLWVKIPSALLGGVTCLWLLRDLRQPLANPLLYGAGSFAVGAMAVGMTVTFALNTLVRFTANQPHTGHTSYVITSGSRSCDYGVAFDDPVLRERIDFCGPRWKIPSTPETGVLKITEASGRFGVLLQQVTAGN
jgi:hypothetical protein